jgi:hypothetical protein
VSTTDELFVFAHVLASFWYVAGLTSVQLTIVRGWKSPDIKIKAESFDEATHYQGQLLVPGGIAVLATGLFMWGQLGYNLVGPAWLILLDVVYTLSLVVCIPLVGIGLRRARVAALVAERRGQSAPDLDEAMNDTVPLIFGGFATVLLPVGAALSVFRPF